MGYAEAFEGVRPSEKKLECPQISETLFHHRRLRLFSVLRFCSQTDFVASQSRARAPLPSDLLAVLAGCQEGLSAYLARHGLCQKLLTMDRFILSDLTWLA